METGFLHLVGGKKLEGVFADIPQTLSAVTKQRDGCADLTCKRITHGATVIFDQQSRFEFLRLCRIIKILMYTLQVHFFNERYADAILEEFGLGHNGLTQRFNTVLTIRYVKGFLLGEYKGTGTGRKPERVQQKY